MLDAAPATPLTASPPFPVARSSLLVSVARPHPRLAGRPCRLDAAPLPRVVFHPPAPSTATPGLLLAAPNLLRHIPILLPTGRRSPPTTASTPTPTGPRRRPELP